LPPLDHQALLERLTALFMQAPLAISFQRGPSHVWELANDAYRQLLGGKELVGKTRKEILPDIASLSGILDRVYETGLPYVGTEFPLKVDRRGDGSWEAAWFNFVCQPTRDAAGAVDGVVTFAVEVTDHVQARRQIEALAGELKLAVHARDEFLSIASHELKTPLTPILLQAQLLKRAAMAHPEGVPSVQVAGRAELISRSIERVAYLVNTLLDVSRITADRLDLTLAEVNLAALTHDVVERHRDAREASGSTLTVHAPVPVVGSWDRLRLDQIATNLIGNAIKYGRGRPIDVYVEHTPDAAVLRIVDEGIGIAPDDQARIFERFERAVSVRHYGGFGLGLWIVRQLVEALGGTIRVTSALDVGSTFEVRLPIHS
jgi:signal transduction histidine kinase